MGCEASTHAARRARSRGYFRLYRGSQPGRVTTSDRDDYGALGLITAHPRAGRQQNRGIRRLTVPRFPYVIFYRIDEAAGAVDVLAVRHAAREQEP